MPEADDGSQRTRVTLFCSTTGKIGQTSTVLNTALVLAGSERRVLVVDARKVGVRATRYLRSQMRGTQGTPSSPSGPVEWEVTANGRRLPVSVLELPGAAGLSDLPDRGDASRSAVYEGFDDVLIDAPFPRTIENRTALARLPHVLVTCFAPDPWAVENAASLARHVREGSGQSLDVVAVGLQVDNRRNEQLRLARHQVRVSFEEFGGGNGSPYVEIPYDALYDQSYSSADDDSARRLRPNFVRLTRMLGRSLPQALRRVTVVHSPRHLTWAEWIVAQLAGSNVRAAAQQFSAFGGDQLVPGTMVLVLSPTGVDPATMTRLAELSHPNVRMVLVDEEPVPHRIAHHEQIDLRQSTEAQAFTRLRQGLELTSVPPAPGGTYRFPRLADRNNLRPRRAWFIGRDDLLLKLREALTATARHGGPCVLLGPAGIGKTELAQEFGHRFGGCYDTVWWVPAHGVDSVRRSLARLAEELGPTAGDGTPEQVLEWLQSPAGGRWLLVYDDVQDLADLDGLVPASAESRYVLVTSRAPAATFGPGTAVTVPAFAAEESRAMLARRVLGLPQHQADQVGQTVGHVPLAIRLAASWLRADTLRLEGDNRPRPQAVQAAVERFVAVFAARQQELLGHGPVSLQRVMLEAVVGELDSSPAGEVWSREDGGTDTPSLVWFLECCALLTASRAELGLLRSPQMLAALARRRTGSTDGGTSEPFVIDAALWSLSRYGLLEVDFGRPDQVVRQQRGLREMIIDRMGEDQRAERERELRPVVGTYAPVVKASRPKPSDEEPSRQIVSLRLWEDERPQVRQSLVHHLVELAQGEDRREWQELVEIGGHAKEAWSSQPLSAEYLRLHGLLATALRKLGRYAEAGRHASVALHGHRTALGPRHPRSLLSADAYGAILRMEGNLTDARYEARNVVRGMKELLGIHHSATVQTRQNLALAEALGGDYGTALVILQEEAAYRRAVGGPDDAGLLDMVETLAFVHRGLGQNRESYRLLKDLFRRKGPAEPTVVAASGLAVSERRLEFFQEAHERDARLLERARTSYGAGQIRTLRVQFSYAADLHALGKHDAAVEESSRCLGLLGTALGEDHPYSHLCRVRLGVHQRSAGNLHAALAAGREALEQLSVLLGPVHPWVAAAEAELASTLVEDRNFGEAIEREKSALECFAELDMTRHPDYETVTHNLADTESRRGSGSPPADTPPRKDIDLELPGL